MGGDSNFMSQNSILAAVVIFKEKLAIISIVSDYIKQLQDFNNQHGEILFYVEPIPIKCNQGT